MMNKMQVVNEGLHKLKGCINVLIGEYEQVHALLEEQIQAVISNDIISLNRLLEQQVDAYEVLKEAERKFKKQIQVFHGVLGNGQKLSLQNVLAILDEPPETLTSLRNQLHDQVTRTERLQGQVMDLLQFARRQNTQIFKAICTLFSNASEQYDARGKKMQRRSHGLAVNQQA